MSSFMNIINAEKMEERITFNITLKRLPNKPIIIYFVHEYEGKFLQSLINCEIELSDEEEQELWNIFRGDIGRLQ